MDIAVLIKQVPDTDEVKMDPEKGTMIRDGVGSLINPLDLNALEAALSLTGQRQETVTVLSMGPPQAERALREGLALGAERAFLLSDRAFAGADTWATAKVLAMLLEKTGPYDLILAGGKATDGETGQVGPEVATLLGLPFATYVSRLEAATEGVTVRRTVEEGYQRLRLPCPCLVTVLHDLNEPSMPTLAGKKRGRRAEVTRWGLADLGLDASEVGLTGSPTRVVRIAHPKIARKTAFYGAKDLDKGIAHVLALLREKALLQGGDRP